MQDFAVFFRYEQDGFISEIVEDSFDWTKAQFLPRIGEDIYLGGCGKTYWWYTVKGVRWFDSQSVTLVLHNRRGSAA